MSTTRDILRRPWRLLVRLGVAVRQTLTHMRFAMRPITFGRGTWISRSCLVRAGVGGRIRIGTHCEIHPASMLLGYGGQITLGDNCSVNPFSVLYGQGGLVIGNSVRIATHVVIIPANHVAAGDGKALHESGVTARGIRIEDDVWIGTGAKILDGVVIGRGAIIGAGSVVTRSVEPGCTVAGVPARVIGRR